jgi:hypothetical protein
MSQETKSKTSVLRGKAWKRILIREMKRSQQKIWCPDTRLDKRHEKDYKTIDSKIINLETKETTALTFRITTQICNEEMSKETHVRTKVKREKDKKVIPLLIIDILSTDQI